MSNNKMIPSQAVLLCANKHSRSNFELKMFKSSRKQNSILCTELTLGWIKANLSTFRNNKRAAFYSKLCKEHFKANQEPKVFSQRWMFSLFISVYRGAKNVKENTSASCQQELKVK